MLIEFRSRLKNVSGARLSVLRSRKGIDKRLLKILKKELQVGEEDIYRIGGPLDLTFLMKVNGMDGFSHLKYRNMCRPKYLSSTMMRISLLRSAATILCSVIRTRLLIRSLILCVRRLKIRMSSRLNRRFIVSAEIRRLSHRLLLLRKTASRYLYLWNLKHALMKRIILTGKDA